MLFLSPLNAELNPICHLIALLGGATIVVVSRLRVNVKEQVCVTYVGCFVCLRPTFNLVSVILANNQTDVLFSMYLFI
jgi:uncharacterized membrane protein